MHVVIEFIKYEAPEILENPNITAPPQLFATINITCTVSGDPPPTIIWYKDDMELPGEQGQTLTLEEVSLESRGRYYCVAVNSDPNNNMGHRLVTSNETILNIDGMKLLNTKFSSLSVRVVENYRVCKSVESPYDLCYH